MPATHVTPLRRRWSMPERTDYRSHREYVAMMIAQTLLSLYMREHGKGLTRLKDLPPEEAQRYLQVGEQAVMTILDPVLERVAVMAAADLFARGEYEGTEQLSIVHTGNRPRAAYLFKLTQRVIAAYRATLALHSPDAEEDRRYDDFLQGLEIDGLVPRG